MKRSKNTRLEIALIAVGLALCALSLVWILIPPHPPLYPLVVSAFAMAIVQIPQLLERRRAGHRGTLPYVICAAMVTLGWIQLILIGLGDHRDWLIGASAIGGVLTVVAAIIIWSAVLERRYAIRPPMFDGRR